MTVVQVLRLAAGGGGRTEDKVLTDFSGVYVVASYISRNVPQRKGQCNIREELEDLEDGRYH